MKNTTPHPSYAGETVYVGIDVHKKQYVISARLHQTIVKKWSTAACPTELAHQLSQYFGAGTIQTVYEAGFSGFDLHRTLTAAGIANRVVHPGAVEVAVHNRVKTDKRDAAKLAEHLEAGRLRGIRIPDVGQEQHRLLSRTRAQLVKERSRVMQQIRMKAHQFGLIEPSTQGRMSHRWVEELLEKALSPDFSLAIGVHHRIWQALDTEIQTLEQQLKQQAEQDPYEATYRSVPGIGLISARVLSNELGNMSHFDNERQLFSYTGLTPSEHSSGERVTRGHITRQGNRHLRGLLIEIAWRAKSKDPALLDCFERLHPRVGKKRAIVAIARKLLGKIRAAFRHQQLYQINFPAPAAA